MPAARLERYGTRKALPLHEALPYTMARPAGAVYVEGGDEGKQAEEEPPSIMPPAWTERALNERQPSRGTGTVFCGLSSFAFYFEAVLSKPLAPNQKTKLRWALCDESRHRYAYLLNVTCA